MKPQHRKHFERFEDHTLFKHHVLRCYANAWLQKMARGPRSPERLLVVDAFAGRGSDLKGNPGSPLRLARAAAMAKSRLEEDGRPVPVHVVAIELEREWFEHLREFLKPFGGAVEVLQGALKEHHQRIRSEYRGVPTLYFLDPFGLKGLEADQVAQALAGEANEVLILFNDPGAERLIGPAVGARPTENTLPGLFDESAQSAPPEEEPSWAEEGWCREILDTAFGDRRWERAIEGIPPGPTRRDVLIREYMGLLREFGAPYTTRLPVWSAECRREYTLVHASRSRHGRQTIKEAMYSALNSSTLPERAKVRALLDMQADLRTIEQRLWVQFEGQDAHWAEKHDPSIREFVLQETDICHPQLPALEARLAPYRMKGRAKVYRFIR